MPLMWIKSDPARRRSEPRPGYAAGKYMIVREKPDRYRLIVNDQPPATLMIGGLEACKQCAEACEPELTEFWYEPELSDLRDLPPEQASVIEKGRRVAVSTERLRVIFARGLPDPVLALELSILYRAARDLGESLKPQEVAT